MKSRWFAAVLVSGTVCTTPLLAQRADPYPHFGLQASVGEDVNIGLGVRYENRMLGMFPEYPNLRFALSFDYFFPDNFDYWEINATGRRRPAGGHRWLVVLVRCIYIHQG